MGTLYGSDGETIATPWSLHERDGVALGTPCEGDGATMCIHEDYGETHVRTMATHHMPWLM